MPVTPTLPTTFTTKSTMAMFMLMLMLLLAVILAPKQQANAVPNNNNFDDNDITSAATANQYDLADLLHTESVLTGALRAYIETLEHKVDVIKSKILEIKSIHDIALNDTDKYLNNPLNALTILKRFTSDWNALRAYAKNNESTIAIVKNITESTKSLKFPSEGDFDDAIGNLLRIQDIYKLEPQQLAVGEVNGVKLGSEMSWSDCLEIGRKSVANEDYMMAKFWMETALEKVPTNLTTTATVAERKNTENEKARFDIMKALFVAEHKMGNVETAFNIINKLLEYNPMHKGFLDTKAFIERQLQQQKEKATETMKEKNSPNTMKQQQQKKKKSNKSEKNKKSAEILLIEEICRDASNSNTHIYASQQKHCAFVRGNLAELLLQPTKVEYFSLDPYIVIYHDVLSVKQIDDLQNLVEDNDEIFKFTSMAQIKLKRFAKQQLQLVTGHQGDLFEPWKVERFTFEGELVFDETLLPKSTKTSANVLFNLQNSKLGGAIVFPQLGFSISVPRTSLLYWSNFNEFHEYDYRTMQYVCPIIASTQITAYSSIKCA